MPSSRFCLPCAVYVFSVGGIERRGEGGGGLGGSNVVVGYGILFNKILNTLSYEKSTSSLKGIKFAT